MDVLIHIVDVGGEYEYTFKKGTSQSNDNNQGYGVDKFSKDTCHEKHGSKSGYGCGNSSRHWCYNF